jgi:hypothetical protein
VCALTGGVPPANTVVTDFHDDLGVIFGRAGLSAGSAVVDNSHAFSQPNGACGLDAAGSINAGYLLDDLEFNDPQSQGSLDVFCEPLRAIGWKRLEIDCPSQS